MPCCLLTLALGAIVVAFPAGARWLLKFEAPMVHRLFPALGIILGAAVLYGLLQWQVLRDIRRRQWCGLLLHLGMLVVLIGGTLTATCARTERLPMALPPSEPLVRLGDNQWEPLHQVATAPHIQPEWRLLYLQGRWHPIYPYTLDYFMPADFQHFAVTEQWGRAQPYPIVPGMGEQWAQEGSAYDRLALEAFRIETYPNGMPSQYISELRFNDDERHTLAVNAPLRRKGLTYYQMSAYTRMVPAVDRYGMPVYFKVLAFDDNLQPRFDEQGRAVYYGENFEYPVEYRMEFTELSVRSDPGAPITFVGYGLLVLGALGMALREERRT